jgi:hypothetical protein
MLLVSTGQTGEAWEPSKKPCFYGNLRALGRKLLPLFLAFQGVTCKTEFNLNFIHSIVLDLHDFLQERKPGVK